MLGLGYLSEAQKGLTCSRQLLLCHVDADNHARRTHQLRRHIAVLPRAATKVEHCEPIQAEREHRPASIVLLENLRGHFREACVCGFLFCGRFASFLCMQKTLHHISFYLDMK